MTTSTASDIKFDLRFEISNLIYPENYAHVACKDPHEQNQTHERTHAQETAPSDEHARFAHARKNAYMSPTQADIGVVWATCR